MFGAQSSSQVETSTAINSCRKLRYTLLNSSKVSYNINGVLVIYNTITLNHVLCALPETTIRNTGKVRRQLSRSKNHKNLITSRGHRNTFSHQFHQFLISTFQLLCKYTQLQTHAQTLIKTIPFLCQHRWCTG